MRIGCLQFAPRVGDVDNNLNRADAVLSRGNPENLDLLVLPELAFTGYNFRSLQHISPFLEPTAAGITSLWARTTALKYNCYVTVGYPERVDVTPKWPAGPEYYNSSVTVNPDGETVINYRKSFLYYTDEKWALEGSGFFGGEIPHLGTVAMGICMDLNPYKFEAPWIAWEFAHHILRVQANLVILSLAWLTREDEEIYSQRPDEPDMDTLSYWLSRLEPVIRAETQGEIIIVLANRCGTEEEAVYAGTSTVLGLNAGEVKVYGILGRGEKELLVVDTSKHAQAKLVSEPNSAAPTVDPLVSQNGAATSQDFGELPVTYEDDIYSPVSPIDTHSSAQFFSKLEREQAFESAVSSPKSGNSKHSSPSPLLDVVTQPVKPTEPEAATQEEIEAEIGQIDENPPISQSQTAAVDAVNPSEPTDQEHMSNTQQLGIPAKQNLSPSAASSTLPHLDQSDSSFIKNDLGPRGQHTSTRPQSTIW